MTEKSDIRRRARSRRQGRQAPDLVASLKDVLSTAERVASYIGLNAEPFVEPRPGWLLPVLRPDNDLDWAAYEGGLGVGLHGLSEPTGPRLGVDAIAACDLVIVPALLVDSDGYRLGQGGGSYDRALARSTGLTVALVYDDEVVPTVPREVHDVPVHAYCTPRQGLVRLS